MLNLTHFSLVAILTLLLAAAPVGAKAQDTSDDEEETMLPQTPSGNPNPPVILDESDSGGVSDVEEYEG